MVKKIITYSILGTMLFSSTAFAQSNSIARYGRGSTSSTNPSSEVRKENSSGQASSTNPGLKVRKENSVCVRKAVDKRNAAISAAQDVFKKAMDDARFARNSALQSVSQATSTAKTVNRTARKAAQKTYQDAVKVAQKAFRKARKAAQDNYRADLKTCRTSQSNR